MRRFILLTYLQITNTSAHGILAIDQVTGMSRSRAFAARIHQVGPNHVNDDSKLSPH